ncbi:hypothetical protein ACJX0J_026499, partial [Zea mays]
CVAHVMNLIVQCLHDFETWLANNGDHNQYKSIFRKWCMLDIKLYMYFSFSSATRNLPIIRYDSKNISIREKQNVWAIGLKENLAHLHRDRVWELKKIDLDLSGYLGSQKVRATSHLDLNIGA